MAELREKFDPIKEGLEGLPFFNRISFMQNQITKDTDTKKMCIRDREDAYARYAGKRVLRDRWQETAFSNTSQAEPFYTLNVTMGFLPVDRLKEIAARYGASITEYLSAVLLLSLIHISSAPPGPSGGRGSAAPLSGRSRNSQGR